MVERIKQLCSDNNMTLASLERELGLTSSSIRRWDNSSPAIEKVQMVAQYLNVSIDFLYGNTDNPKEVLGLTDDEREFLDVYIKAKKSDKQNVKDMLKIIDNLLDGDEE